MDADMSLQIIRPLSEGVHPVSGKELAVDDTCQHPQVIRALLGAVSALEALQETEARQLERPARAGRPWSTEDDRNLAADVASGLALRDLATRHERSRGAIAARLEKLGILPAA